jgi:hypothetical protein
LLFLFFDDFIEIGNFTVELLTATCAQYDVVSKVTAALEPRIEPSKKTAEKESTSLINFEKGIVNNIASFAAIKYVMYIVVV